MKTIVLEGNNRTIFRKSDFIFEDAALDTDQQLLVGESRWVYTLDGKRYYLPGSRRHYPLAYFQSVTTERKMSWSVSRCMESVHVGILTYNGFSRWGPPQSIIGLHPGNVSRDVPVGESPAKVPTFLN